MSLEYRNPEIPEGINTTEAHPLKEFSFLLGIVIAGVVVITAFLTVFIDWSARYIPFEFETALSRPLVEKLNKEPNEVDKYLQQLANKIIPYMDLPENVKIHLHYVNEDTVNAVATLGGHVMIYRGLLEQLPDESTLVMLLGHEIGHVKLRHPVQALGKGVVISLVMSTVLGHSSDSVANVISDSSMLTLLSFNRDQEQDSDEEGLKVLNAYYGNVHGATELFDVLENSQQEEGIDIPQLLSSHPDTETRRKHLHELAKLQSWTQQGQPRPIPERIRRIMTADRLQMR